MRLAEVAHRRKVYLRGRNVSGGGCRTKDGILRVRTSLVEVAYRRVVSCGVAALPLEEAH